MVGKPAPLHPLALVPPRLAERLVNLQTALEGTAIVPLDALRMVWLDGYEAGNRCQGDR